MLRGKLEYTRDNKVYEYDVYVLDEYRSSIVRLVGLDSDSANLLMDNQYGVARRNFRSILFNPTGMTVERLFGSKELVIDGVDWGTAKNFKTLPSFDFMVGLYCVYNYAKVLKDTAQDEVEIDGFKSLDGVRKTEFNTGILRGYVERSLGVVDALELVHPSYRLSLKADSKFDSLSVQEKIEKMGSSTLVSKFTKLKIDIPRSIVDDFCGVKNEEVEVAIEGGFTQSDDLEIALEGISKYSPYYETVDDVVKAHPHKNFSWR